VNEAPWWHYALGIGLLLVIVIVRLSPDIYMMILQRKERKLWGYDKTEFAKAEKLEKDED
jgi:hypothetical protein